GLPLAVHAWVELVERRWAGARAVAIHAGVTGGFAIFFVLVWAVTTRGYFWPFWPILAFVAVLAAHVLIARPTGVIRRLRETGAYFVVAESLANAGKHAGATAVQVRIARRGDSLEVEVEDDGRGGADPAGNGLRGLRQRVEALDGTFAVTSPRGGPTVVRAELPCGL